MEREQRGCNIHRSVYIFMSSANVLCCQVNAGVFFWLSETVYVHVCVSECVLADVRV